VDTFTEWSSSPELDLEEPFWENLQSHGDMLSADCTALDHQPDFPSPSINFIANATPSTSYRTTINATSINPTTVSSSPAPEPCPCCNMAVDTTQIDFHTHVSRCFVGRKRMQQAQGPKSNPLRSAANARSKINSIRQIAAQMPLSARIGLLESLSRLAQSAKGPNCSGSVRRADHFTLSLLYKDAPPPPALNRQKKRKVEMLTVNTQGQSPFSKESYTPTTIAGQSKSLPPFGLGSSFLLLNRTSTCTPPVHAGVKGRPSAGKRKRDVVQALHFSPRPQPLDQPFLELPL
jgi:hypothetical protein